MSSLGFRIAVAYVVSTVSIVAHAATLNFVVGGELPVDVGTLGGTQTILLDQNDAGEAVGYSYLFVSANFRNAVMWDATNGLVDLGTPGTTYSFALAVNELGTAVGYGLNEDNTAVPFIWDATNGMQALPTLGGSFAVACDVNINNEVCGYSFDASGRLRAFVWDATNGIRDLGELGLGGETALGFGINDDGVITGEAEGIPGDFRVFIWDENNGMRDIGVSGTGYDINELGFVTGVYGAPNGEGHAFLWDGIVFTTDFESGLPAEISTSDWSVETMETGDDGTYGDQGFSGTQFLRSGDKKGTKTMTLSLSGLPTHTSIDLNLLLAAIDKTQVGDGIEIRVDGATIFNDSITFDTAAWNPGTPIEMFSNLELGYKDNPQGYDTGFNMGLVGPADHTTLIDFSAIPHIASTLTVEIIATTAKKGPTYAIDDLSVILNASDPVDLGTLGGTLSIGYGLNEAGQVVGVSAMPDGSAHGFVWDPSNGVMTDLNDFLVPGSGWIITQMWNINNFGDIAGEGFNASIRGIVLQNP